MVTLCSSFSQLSVKVREWKGFIHWSLLGRESSAKYKKRLQVQKKLKELKPLKSFCMSCRYCLNKQKKLLFLSIFGSSIVDFSKFISIKYGCSHYTVTFVILLSHMITFGLQIYQLAVDIYASFAIFLTFRCSLYIATYANTSAWCIINNNGNLYRVICSIIPATLKSKRIHG